MQGFSRASVCLVLGLLPWRPASAAAQGDPTITIATTDRDTILKILKLEAADAGMTFHKLYRDRAIYRKDAGRRSVRGEIVTVFLETTFRLTDVSEGTRLVVTEILSAALSTGSEQRTPDRSERYDAYMGILERTRARVEPPAKTATDSGS